MKFLAINFGGLGDEVLFLPTLKSVKAANPDWEITLLTEPRSKAIAQLSRLIDQNIVFDIKKDLQVGDYLDLVSLIRKGKYDIVLSSGSSSKVCILLFLSGIKTRVGYDSGSLSRMLLTSAVPLNKEQYAGEMYHDLVRGLNIKLPSSAPRVDLDHQALNKMRGFVQDERKKAACITSGKLIIIHPGMSQMALKKGIIKTWSSRNWAELTRKLLAHNLEVMLCGGPDDEATVSDIKKQLGDMPDAQGGLFIDAYGKTSSIQELAALMELSELVICVDSAPMHIASALQKSIVALFGPTDPDKLLLQNNRVIAIKEHPAEAASITPDSEPAVRIPLDTVYQTAADLLRLT